MCALHAATAQEPSAAAPKSQSVIARKYSLSSLPVSIQSPLNSAENEVLFLLYVQDDLFSLLWMLKSLESRWIVLAELGSGGQVECSLSSALLHVQDLVVLLPVLLGLALQPSVQPADFFKTCLSSSIFLFPSVALSHSISPNISPFYYCW